MTMKIKEAIAVLESFKQIAGEDATVAIGWLELHALVDVEYYHGYGNRAEKERKTTWTVVVGSQPSDKQGPSPPDGYIDVNRFD